MPVVLWLWLMIQLAQLNALKKELAKLKKQAAAGGGGQKTPGLARPI